MTEEEIKKVEEFIDILMMELHSRMMENIKRYRKHEYSENQLVNLDDCMHMLTVYLQEYIDKLVMLSMKVKVELDKETARGQ